MINREPCCGTTATVVRHDADPRQWTLHSDEDGGREIVAAIVPVTDEAAGPLDMQDRPLCGTKIQRIDLEPDIDTRANH